MIRFEMRNCFSYICAISILLSTGCATTTVINKIPQPQIETAMQAEIKVCRQRIFMGDGTTTITSIDTKPIVRSGPGKCFSAKLDIGKHVLNVVAKGWFDLETGEREFVLQEGQTKYFKLRLEKVDEISESEYSSFKEYDHIAVQ